MPTLLEAWIRPLASVESPPLFLGAAAVDSPVDTSALKQTNLQETVVDFLLDIHDKLNHILSILSQDKLTRQFPIHGRVVEISGSGLAIIPEKDLEPGQPLEIVMALDQLPMILAGAVGVVENRVETKEGPALAVSFKRIRLEDQEAVIQYVFRQERRNIREQRLD